MCQGEWEVGWIGGDRDGICMRGEDAAGLELWMGAGAHSSGLALSARGVSLSLEQAALGFCQLEQVPEISHASQTQCLHCVIPAFLRGKLLLAFPFLPWASPSALKHTWPVISMAIASGQANPLQSGSSKTVKTLGRGCWGEIPFPRVVGSIMSIPAGQVRALVTEQVISQTSASEQPVGSFPDSSVSHRSRD